MRRREFIALLSGVAVGWPLAAGAERPPFVVGMIGNGGPYWPHFREAMRDLGYREGQNVKYELRTDETEPARLAEAAKELANIPVDVIVAYGSPPSQAAQAATRTIPIVMVSVGDPVRVHHQSDVRKGAWADDSCIIDVACRRTNRINTADFRYWHKADIADAVSHVCFWG